MTHRLALLLCTAALGAAAPAAVALAQTRELPSDAPDAQILDGTAQRQLDAARARWKAAKLLNYRFRVQHSCFCAGTAFGEQLVTVRRGAPVAVDRGVSFIATVPRLFLQVQAAIDHRVSRLTVTYDARLGYPRSIAIDPDARTLDEEDYFKARSLVPTPKRK